MSHMRDLKVGDRVVRMLAGTIPMTLAITGIDELYVYCGANYDSENKDDFAGWKFNRFVGYEVDEDLGWGVLQEDGTIYTGSYIAGKEEE